MRTILFFDLPSITDSEKKAYRYFVKEIKKLGFYRIQESVFVKMSIDTQNAESIVSKIKIILPKDGNVMLLTVTEKQFSSMQVLLGESISDVVSSDERIIIL